MTPEEEAHWRYQLEILTSWGYHDRMINQDTWNKVPDEVAWLREQARYKGHLATVHLRHQAAAVGKDVL